MIGPTRRILVVDDDAEVRELLYVALRKQGFQIDLASSAAEVLDLFKQNTYDLVTLDYAMPGINGLRLHQRLSELYGFGRRLAQFIPPRLPPTLVISGYGREDLNQAWLAEEQVAAILPKPLRLAEFVAVVSEVVSRGLCGERRGA
jgi:CheY-like chemotaxis protein